jgi:cell division protease FtsH
MLFNLLLMPYIVSRQIVEVDYGTFMSEIEEGTLDTVQLQDNRILFITKDSTTVYETGLVDDPTLTQRLYESGVTFSSEIVETASPFQTVLLYHRSFQRY